MGNWHILFTSRAGRGGLHERPGRQSRTETPHRLVRESFSASARHYPAGRAGPGLFALPLKRDACGVACALCGGQSRAGGRCRPSVTRDQSVSLVQILCRQRWADCGLLRCDAARLSRANGSLDRVGAGGNVPVPPRERARISRHSGFRCLVRHHGRRDAVRAAFQPRGSPLSRARPLWSSGMDAVRRDAGCTAWTTRCDRDSGKPDHDLYRLCGAADSGGRLSCNHRRAPPVSIPASRRAWRLVLAPALALVSARVLALDRGAVPPRVPVCRRRRY